MPLARCTHSWYESSGIIDRRSRREYRNSQEGLPVATYLPADIEAVYKTQPNRSSAGCDPGGSAEFPAPRLAEPPYDRRPIPSCQQYFELYRRRQQGAGAEKKDDVRKYM